MNLLFFVPTLFVVLAHSLGVSLASDAACLDDAFALLDHSGRVFETKVTLAIHRSGEPEPCGMIVLAREALRMATQAIRPTSCPMTKYHVESILTAYLRDQLDAQSCRSIDNATAPSGLVGWCDMGPERTTIQPDHHQLVSQPDGSLPCRYFTREGRRLSSLRELLEWSDGALENWENCEPQQLEPDQSCPLGPILHLHAVPAGRLFQFAPSFVGEQFVLDHVVGKEDQPVVLQVISIEPRIFEIHNFFSQDDAQELIAKTLAETDEEMGLHRSRTGSTTKTVYDKRTSENAWDTAGEKAVEIKTNCLRMLGFDDYWPGHTDGLQILRYQNGQAYVAHHDYLRIHQEDKNDPYDYDSSKTGGNRFATVLLYMTDLGELDGGETLFQKAVRPGSDRLPTAEEAVRQLRSSGDPNLVALQPDSWEETMTAMCRTRLAIRPRAGRAVLFYSQHPNGQQDKSALHGGCPVLDGTKWAANLWVWNAERKGSPFAPMKKDAPQPRELHVTFRNNQGDPRMEEAELFWKNSSWYGRLGPGVSRRYITYKGHIWNIKVDGVIVKSYNISGEHEEVLVEI